VLFAFFVAKNPRPARDLRIKMPKGSSCAPPPDLFSLAAGAKMIPVELK
jgi:hypothetical protein